MTANRATLPTWAVQQVGRYLGNTGRDANVVGKATARVTGAAPARHRLVEIYAIGITVLEHRQSERAGRAFLLRS